MENIKLYKYKAYISVELTSKPKYMNMEFSYRSSYKPQTSEEYYELFDELVRIELEKKGVSKSKVVAYTPMVRFIGEDK